MPPAARPAPQAASGVDVKAALAKVGRLVTYVEKHGPLDGLTSDVHIDLTLNAVDNSRTASRGEPGE